MPLSSLCHPQGATRSTSSSIQRMPEQRTITQLTTPTRSQRQTSKVQVPITHHAEALFHEAEAASHSTLTSKHKIKVSRRSSCKNGRQSHASLPCTHLLQVCHHRCRDKSMCRLRPRYLQVQPNPEVVASGTRCLPCSDCEQYVPTQALLPESGYLHRMLANVSYLFLHCLEFSPFFDPRYASTYDSSLSCSYAELRHLNINCEVLA